MSDENDKPFFIKIKKGKQFILSPYTNISELRVDIKDKSVMVYWLNGEHLLVQDPNDITLQRGITLKEEK